MIKKAIDAIHQMTLHVFEVGEGKQWQARTMELIRSYLADQMPNWLVVS